MRGAARPSAATNVALLAGPTLLGLGLRLSWVIGDLDELLRYATSDDAYYYFEIARRVASGAPPSLDGETATNGFHPLWLALLVPVQWLVRDGELALRLGLALGAALGAGSIALLQRSVARVTASPAAAVFAATLYAVHPTAITESVNGLETALAVFTTAWLVDRFLAATMDPPSRRSALWLGVAGAAALLARTDAVFLWAALLLGLAVARRSLGPALLAGGLSTLAVLPWLAWNIASFGSVMQVSAVALPESLRTDFLARHGEAWGPRLERSTFLLRRAFTDQLPHLHLVPRGLPVWPAAMAAALATAGVLRDTAGRRALGLLAPLAAIPFTLAWHAGVRWWTREWYFAPSGWLLALGAGLAAAALLHALERLTPAAARLGKHTAGVAATALIGALAAPPLAAAWRAPSEHRVQQLEAAGWLATRTAPATRIGAFNAGIYAYFSERTVVNLDGVVNADALAARRAGQLLEYLDARGIELVVDWRGTLPLLGCGRVPGFACIRLETVGEPIPGFAGSPVEVWAVRRADARAAD